MPGTEKTTVMPRPATSSAERARRRAVDEDQGERPMTTGDMARRDVDERIREPRPREAMAGQDERHADAEDGVEWHGDGYDEQREEAACGARPGW